jgi:hypothetical protein
VHDRNYIRTHSKNLTVDEALVVDASAPLIHGQTVLVELHDVVGGHQRRRAIARHQKMFRVLEGTDGDVPVAVEHVVVGEDVVGNHQIGDALLFAVRRKFIRRNRGRRLSPGACRGTCHCSKRRAEEYPATDQGPLAFHG